MASLKWLLATRNNHKVLELRKILEPYPIELLGLDDLGITQESHETGNTFLENAMQKADFYFRLAQMPTVSDDSGLEVDSLNGVPGIHSARFGGFKTHAEKCAYLLGLINDVPPEYRNARFHCAAVFYDGREFLSSEASIEGFIGSLPVGDGGFGYDPIFHPELGGPSMAEIPIETKNKISHRGQAFTSLVGAYMEREKENSGK